MGSSEESCCPPTYTHNDCSPFLETNNNHSETDIHVEKPIVPLTTRKELWSYYLYFFGDNGASFYIYVPIILQYLATRAGTLPSDPLHKTPCDMDDENAPCEIAVGPFGYVNVSSMVLFTQAASCLILAVSCTALGALADYADYGKWILVATTVISCAAQFAVLGVYEPANWWIMGILALIVYVTIGATIIFYTASFPSLAANLPNVRAAKRNALSGPVDCNEADIGATKEERSHKAEELLMFERSKISNISNGMLSFGFAMTTLLCVIPTQENDLYKPAYANNISCAVSALIMISCAIPWFLFQQKRPKPSLPEGSSYLTIGWKTVFAAFKNMKSLSQTFTYLFGYFIVADAQATTMGIANIIVFKILFKQMNFSFWQTLFGTLSALSGAAGFPAFYLFQKTFKLTTKTMCQITNICVLVVPLWGMIGHWTNSFGLHTWAEVWVFAGYTFFINPFYAYSATFMSELIPRGEENLYFGVYGIVGRTSSFIGPLIVAAIVNVYGSEWLGFVFCAVLMLAAIVCIHMVDVPKAKQQLEAYERGREPTSNTSEAN